MCLIRFVNWFNIFGTNLISLFIQYMIVLWQYYGVYLSMSVGVYYLYVMFFIKQKRLINLVNFYGFSKINYATFINTFVASYWFFPWPSIFRGVMAIIWKLIYASTITLFRNFCNVLYGNVFPESSFVFIILCLADSKIKNNSKFMYFFYKSIF